MEERCVVKTEKMQKKAFCSDTKDRRLCKERIGKTDRSCQC